MCQGEKAYTDNTFPKGRSHFHSSTTDRATAEAREALLNEHCVITAALIALPVAHCHFKLAFKETVENVGERGKNYRILTMYNEVLTHNFQDEF